MERLISLFREPDGDGYLTPDAERILQASMKAESDEPIYFQQLLEYLRQEKDRHKRSGAEGAD